MSKETMTHEKQAIILKGIASQLLQMNMPTFEHLKKMLKTMEVTDWVVEPAHEVYNRALLMCMMITQGCGKKTYQSFGERIEEILQYAGRFDQAADAVMALSLKK
jgi:hypothetical protein